MPVSYTHLPVEADEVVVTRKYYRSGDSEYKINDKTVRLRDIHELFMDTGLGRDGYSIIGQGRISDIISAKSGQRREILEEAAGISRYRYRKEEAQRQLEMAEENLLRLKDIMTEIQSNLEPLRQQSEKASAFLKLSGRKKELDISLWLENLEQTRRQLKGYDDRLLILQGQYDEAEERYRRSEEELEALYSRMQQAAVKIDELQREIRTEMCIRDRCCDLLDFLEGRGIQVIRLGLHPSEELEENMVAGAYHPAFRELCEGERFYRRILALAREQTGNSDGSLPNALSLLASPRDLSKAIGQGKRNLKRLEALGCKTVVLPDDGVEPGTLRVQRASENSESSS